MVPHRTWPGRRDRFCVERGVIRLGGTVPAATQRRRDATAALHCTALVV
jgi:hypothetical protein